ncbi:beta-lactamase-like protein [Aspergillus californicus]
MAQLVPLPEVERLSASVVRILGANPGKVGTNTYLVGQGPRRILIDTGEGKQLWAARLKQVLTDEKATIHQALITHWHHDHVGGIPDLLRLFPEVTVYKHQPVGGQKDIEDGQVFSIDGATLRACHTPGHTVDHMMLVLEEEDAIFTGDNVLGHGTAVFEDLKTYLDSLQRMQNRVSGRGYPGHGAVLENATAKITEYIRHRQQREDEIIRVLRYGKLDVEERERSPEPKSSWTPLEIVKIIYHNVPENLHLPASNGVIQVLTKLEAEGKVIHDADSGRWTLNTGKSAL